MVYNAANKAPEALTDTQSQRLIFAYKTAALLIVALTLPWSLYFIWIGQWPIAIANLILMALAGVSSLLIRSGRLNTALVVCELTLVIFTVLYTLMFDEPSEGAPRVTHLYLLVLAMLGYIGHLRRKSAFQLAVTAVSLVAFVALSCTTYAFPFAQPIPDDVRSIGIWANGILSTTMMCFGIYAIQREITRPKGMALELSSAVRKGEMELHFQPQIDLAGKVLGAEALLRWQHPKRGRIPPGDFIAVAEAAGLMPLLGGWVIQEACRTLALWGDDPVLRTLTLAVNVSADQFQVEDFESSVLEAIRVHGVDPARLKIELTESVIVHDLEPVIAKIENLRAAGIRFALDDFGTGYSSLSYLRQLPLDQLKIDRSFVRESLDTDRGTALARSIVQLGLDLGFVVLAEGIETPAQHAFLRDCGCHEFQGYLFGRPMPAGAFAEHVREATRTASQAAPALRLAVVDWPKQLRERGGTA
ncbi:EAL domain-containing protein [Hoeflea sp.]|uniref:EAL domain-containing protein n=1 Tax=Hoeflea sp. TaxID=1940281 RepID=UPI0019C11AB7|nr:EAL domain-containing protein [Hoeflea sp.]MBC7281171.1 EAL domain-containing protein [Hoeflea sp.]